jgi:hypothetical protein
MNAKRETGLVEEALTHSVIRSFYDVHRELGFGFREYLYALALERGLLLHFGRDPKFQRVICENRFKRHRSGDGGLKSL